MQNRPSPATALIIGGSGLIGRAICLHFGKAHWQVGIHYRTQKETAQKTAELVNQVGGKGSIFRADIRNTEEIRHMVQTVMSTWDRLDVLVYGVGLAIDRIMLRMSPQNWSDMLDTNLTGTFHCLKTLGPFFQKQREGTVILVGSLSSSKGEAGQTGYAAAKAGLIGLMRTAAKEWGPYNIRVNAVFPGWHPSQLSGTAFPHADSLQDHILNRTPALEEVAKTIFHLATLQDVSGQVWNLDSRLW